MGKKKTVEDICQVCSVFDFMEEEKEREVGGGMEGESISGI